MCPGLVQRNEMSFLSRAEFGLLAAEPALGARDLHSFAGSHPDQIRLELGDHRQDVEEQTTDGIGRIVN